MTKNETTELRLARKDLPDVLIKGKLLASIDSDTAGRDGGGRQGRWTRLQLWELKNGDWVAASIGCSDRPNEIDIGSIERVAAFHPTRGKPPGEKPAVDEDERRRRVLLFFGYSWLAKKLADQLGWDMLEVIE